MTGPAAAPPVRWLQGVLLVTGTGTGVGKTVAVAALAGRALAGGARVAVYKPTQTGVHDDEPGDVDEVARQVLADPDTLSWRTTRAGRVGAARLPGVDLTLCEGVRLRDPLAPAAAARREGRTLPTVLEHADVVSGLARAHDLVLVEGAGGLLVELDSAGGTLADIGVALTHRTAQLGVVVVCAAGLGTLNHTALTAEALRHRQLPLRGLLVGSWPPEPSVDLAMRENLADLPRIAGAPLLGRLPAGAGGLDAEAFVRRSMTWLAEDVPALPCD